MGSLRKKVRFWASALLLLLLFLLQIDSRSLVGATNIPLGSTLSPSNASSWSSPTGTFSFGFVSDPQSPSLYLAAITYSGGIIVWSAGGSGSGNASVDSAASLQLRDDGNLRLVNGSGTLVWESGTASKGASAAALLDSGDFVLKNSTAVVWDTYDNPTDTILQSQSFTFGQVLRSGVYSFSLTQSGNLTLTWNDSITYFNKGFNSTFTANKSLASPVLTLQANGIVSLSDASLSTAVVIAYSSDYGESDDIIRFMKLDSDGNLRTYTAFKDAAVAPQRWAAVADQCEVFGWCGNMGICSYNDTSPTCGCPSRNFDFVDPDDHRKGCKRRREIQDCPGNSTTVQLDHTRFLTYAPEISSEQFFVGIAACRLNCLSGGSCVASTALADGSGFCYLKVSNFVSGYQSTALPSTSFVKVCAPALPNSPSPPGELRSQSSNPRGWLVAVLVFGTVSGLMLFEWGLWRCFCRNGARYGPSSAQYALLDFGMVLLEIVSGRRNFDVSDDTGRKKFSVWAYEELEKGNIRSTMDKRLAEQDVDMEQLKRVVLVSFWCIQEQPSQRPPMGKVVQMLEGVLAVDKPPAPKAADGGLAAVTSITVSATSSPTQPSSTSSHSIASSSLVSKRNLDKPSSSLVLPDQSSS
ncbi:hypothetical protein OPV22_000985 [Ensete ventricosum]|uniref:non-specific serine/threonine protein kinase n=1 Tax=Ensete ventricosum TaxID=4639 RepID=A0AAV8RRF8_ENSVE|nr:hypothetical protein OPV22_000985 [Ensete ventricosum]